jgi:cyclopropane fatty-acyl-phospholipid synthase-like methyltransferase
MLAFSEACERNKQPILGMLRDELERSSRVLEIGSGTGQHAVHFARHMQHLEWQPTDRADCLHDLAARIAEEGTPNLLAPLELDVRQRQWPVVTADAVYTANTLHIMSWPEVEAFFSGVGHALPAGGVLVVYGPFRYAGRYTSGSNAAFDRSLRERDTASGIRDIEAVNRLAETQGLALIADHAMPANNQLVVWARGRSQATRT